MAALTTDARQILARLELLMHGKTQSFDSSGGKSDDRNPVPQGEARPPADHWRLIFLRCAEHDLPALIREAQDELRAILVRDQSGPPIEEDGDAWELRIIEEGEGHAADVVALAFACAVQTVTKFRRQHNRDLNLGHPILAMPQHAAKLKDSGLNQTQIARALGVSQPTVSRLLASAA